MCAQPFLQSGNVFYLTSGVGQRLFTPWIRTDDSRIPLGGLYIASSADLATPRIRTRQQDRLLDLYDLTTNSFNYSTFKGAQSGASLLPFISV